jgi:hypothetical protein
MTAIALAAAMTVSMTGCFGRSSGKYDDKDTDNASTEASGAGGDQNSFPEDFGDMSYPIEALMVEAYAKGLPYYNEDSDEEDADSFWYSMAVLTSQMNTYVKDMAVDKDDNYIYVSEDTASMYAAALYDAYGKGTMEFPELEDEDSYAVYDDEQETYGFRRGDIGDLESMMTGCTASGDDYMVTSELRNAESGKVLGIYEVTITPTAYDGEDNAFAYAVSDFKVTDMDESAYEELTEDKSESSEEATEATEEDETTEEATTEEDTEENEETTKISQEEALSLAKDYYGSEAEYKYKGMVTVGDYDYYDFSVSSEEIDATDVLVSETGQDVIGGKTNSDGTWSFDQ